MYSEGMFMPTAFSKIGFHMAEGGNANGIGDYMKRLDAANIPFFMKGADSMAGIFDAQEIIRKRRQQGKPDIHTSVFRLSGQGPGGEFDIPNYRLPPEQAATEHWAFHKANFPPDLDKSISWVEHINEVRKEVEWGDWLGKFSVHAAKLAMQDGYKYLAFGFSAGTPEAASWETEGMLAYMELCARHPDKVAVALHEYSYKTTDIWRERDYLIGGFKWLFRACDKNNIPRPKVFMTEWGWEYQNVPDPQTALRHIKEVGQLYAQFPEIVGAAIWYLGGGYGNIHNQTQRLIAPVTEFTLNHRYQVSNGSALVRVPTDPPDFAGTRGATEIGPRGGNPPDTGGGTPDLPSPRRDPFAVKFLGDETIGDWSLLDPGKAFTKGWKIQNTGTTAWNERVTVRLVAGNGMIANPQQHRAVPRLAVGQAGSLRIDMFAPRSAGRHEGSWQLHDVNGEPFGPTLVVRVRVPEVVQPVLGAGFVRHLTLPPNTEVMPTEDLVKSWQVKNTGNAPWGAGYRLVHVAGKRLANAGIFPIPPATPGQIVTISFDVKLPPDSGSYHSEWRFQDSRGWFFGDTLSLDIVVKDPITEGIVDARFSSETIPDGTEFGVGKPFLKIWRLRNTGTRDWGDGFTLEHVSGAKLSDQPSFPVPPTAVGEVAEIEVTLVAPESVGTVRSNWQMQDERGRNFGQVVWVEIKVMPLPDEQPPVPDNRRLKNSRYIADVSIPDGQMLVVGQRFTKTWRVENSGQLAWETSYVLGHLDGEAMTEVVHQKMPAVDPNEIVELSINMIAPNRPGGYVGQWQIMDTQGRPFGTNLMVEVNVVPKITTTFSGDATAWRDGVWRVTSVFESGSPEGRPEAFQTFDSGIVSYGRHQATLASGHLEHVLRLYWENSDTPLARALQGEYEGRVRNKDEGLRDDARFRDLLLAAATDPKMVAAQDQVFDTNFYRPAVDVWQSQGLKSPLALACLYDTRIQGGLGDVIRKTQELGLPAEVGEAAWLAHFLDEREKRLYRLADSAEARGESNMAVALRNSSYRVKALRKVLNAGNLALEGEFFIRRNRIKGVEHE
jgi:hypothetical protein